MSKKSRKNPSKPAVTKAVAKTAKKASKKATKPAAKRAAKTTGTTKPASKAAAKAPAKKAAMKAAAKPVKAAAPKKAVVAKAPATKAAVTKAPAPKPAAKASKKPTAKPLVEPVAAAISKPIAAPAPAVAIEGSTAPAFQLPRDGGATVSLADYAGRKLVIFFYPRANTPGCTKEAIDFSRLSGAFEAADTAILGVSADSQKAQESFRDKHDLATPLLSDLTHEMLKAYEAWGEKSMYGKTFEGVLRTSVLIGADGVVARIWRHVKVDGHAEAVLEEVRRL